MDERTECIFRLLRTVYPEPKTELVFQNNFQLLVAVMLSARCTDKRVNIVTSSLFAVANNAYELANLPIETIERIIYSCGFYREKAFNIQSAARDICERFNGEVPDDFSDLLSLRGVGRKTANVVMAVGFSKPALAVDTHVFRLSNRLGITNASTPLECENKLTATIDSSLWDTYHHLLILHGRYVCKSHKPRCSECAVLNLCPYDKKNI